MPAILVTGSPGCGKTTLIRRAVAQLASVGVPAGGFVTDEVRDRGGRRMGFEVVTLDGRRARLAGPAEALPGAPRVGRYGIDLPSFEAVGVPALTDAVEAGRLVVIDEIGKMELLSAAFQRAVIEALRRNRCVLGTITERPHPFADELKAQPDVTVVRMTVANREDTLARAVMLTQACVGRLTV